jgi:hypothetical protein
MFLVPSAGVLLTIWTGLGALETSVVRPFRVASRESATRFGVTVKDVVPTAPGVK